MAAGTLLAVASVAGCSSDSKSNGPDLSAEAGPLSIITATPPTQTDSADATSNNNSNSSPSDSNANTPTSLNVFGEFPGVPHAQNGGPVGRGGFQQHTFLDEGADDDVAVDPTGKWMCYTSTRNSEHPNLCLQRVDGLSVIQLTDDAADYAYPSFSPDGKQVTFCSTRTGNWQIYTMDVDGRNVVQVTSDSMQNVHPSFSSDGGHLVYSSIGSRSGQWELWTADLTTGEKKMIGFGLFPSWSPDKSVNRIVYQRARQRGSRWFSLWTLDMVNGEARRVTEVAVCSNAAIVAPVWSSDGKRIAFATIAQPQNSPHGKLPGQQDIWTINADGSNRHRITDGVGCNFSPYWSADNRIYFISDRNGQECIWSSEPDEPSLIQQDLAVASPPQVPAAAAISAPAPQPAVQASVPADVTTDTVNALPTTRANEPESLGVAK